MIEIYWSYNEKDFTLDWENDPDCLGCDDSIKQQFYALIMGWA